MVGQKIKLADMTGKYVGKSFAECTCMRLAYGWYHDIGIDVPDSFGDLNIENYLAAWNADKKKTLASMVELFLTLGKPVEDLNALKKHDLLAVEEEGNLYAAISLGGKMAITSHYIEGVRVFFLGERHRVVLARRMI